MCTIFLFCTLTLVLFSLVLCIHIFDMILVIMVRGPEVKGHLFSVTVMQYSTNAICTPYFN